MNNEKIYLTAYNFKDSNKKTINFIDSNNHSIEANFTLAFNKEFKLNAQTCDFTRFYLTLSAIESDTNDIAYQKQYFIDLSNLEAENVSILSLSYNLFLSIPVNTSKINSFNMILSYAHLNKKDENNIKAISNYLSKNIFFETAIPCNGEING